MAPLVPVAGTKFRVFESVKIFASSFDVIQERVQKSKEGRSLSCCVLGQTTLWIVQLTDAETLRKLTANGGFRVDLDP